MTGGRVQIVDKGYGYFREWMDSGVPEAIIVKTIRLMYQAKVSDVRDLVDDNRDDPQSPLVKLPGGVC